MATWRDVDMYEQRMVRVTAAIADLLEQADRLGISQEDRDDIMNRAVALQDGMRHTFYGLRVNVQTARGTRR